MKRINIFFALMLAVGILFAADMIIHKTDGSEVVVDINEIEQITFSSWNETTVEGITLYWMADSEYLNVMV